MPNSSHLTCTPNKCNSNFHWTWDLEPLIIQVSRLMSKFHRVGCSKSSFNSEYCNYFKIKKKHVSIQKDVKGLPILFHHFAFLQCHHYGIYRKMNRRSVLLKMWRRVVWKMYTKVPLERQYFSLIINGTTSHKTVIFSFTTLKTLNLTWKWIARTKYEFRKIHFLSVRNLQKTEGRAMSECIHLAVSTGNITVK